MEIQRFWEKRTVVSLGESIFTWVDGEEYIKNNRKNKIIVKIIKDPVCSFLSHI